MADLRNPCKDCRYRHIGCHDHCFLYKEWKNQTVIAHELLKRDNEISSYLHHHKKVRKR